MNPHEDSATGLGHTLIHWLQPSVVNFFNVSRVLVNGMKNSVVSLYVGIENAILPATHLVLGTATPEELVNIRIQPVHDGPVMFVGEDLEGTTEASLSEDSRPSISEAHDSEETNPPSDTSVEHGSNEASALRSRRKWMLMAMLAVGVLALVVVPGVVLGSVTRQLPLGIALSGAIATVVGVIAGLYFRQRTQE